MWVLRASGRSSGGLFHFGELAVRFVELREHGLIFAIADEVLLEQALIHRGIDRLALAAGGGDLFKR